MVEIKKGFGQAGDATASIPTEAQDEEIVWMGNDVDRGHISTVLAGIKNGINAGQISPVNIYAETRAPMKVAPGGRDPAELDQSLLEGRQAYTPQPLFE